MLLIFKPAAIESARRCGQVNHAQRGVAAEVGGVGVKLHGVVCVRG